MEKKENKLKLLANKHKRLLEGKKTKDIFCCFGMFLVALSYVIYIEYIFAFYLCVMFVYSLYLTRKNWLLFIVFLFIGYCNYSICAANVFDLLSDFFTLWRDTEVAYVGLRILVLFNTIIFFMLPHDIPLKDVQISYKSKNSSEVISFLVIILLVIIYIFGYDRVDDGRGTPSTLFEYSIIIFIVGLYFRGDNKIITILYLFLGVLYMYLNFSGGGRVTALQIAIVFFLFFIVDRWQSKSIFLGCAIVGVVGMNLIGMYRDSVSIIYFFDSLSDLLLSGFALDTAYSAYFTGLTFIQVASEVTIATRLQMFLLLALSMIFGGSIVSGANLSEYTYEIYMHYYGGVLPMHFYFYFGMLGVVLVAILVGLYIKKIHSFNVKTSGADRCLCIYLVSSSLRWYLYSSNNLFRGALLVIICFYMMKFIIKTVNKI